MLSTYISESLDARTDRLRARATFLQGLAWAPSTRKTLDSQTRTFVDFLVDMGLDSLPVSGDSLVLYGTFLVDSKKVGCIGSLRQYLSAARTLHRSRGLTCDTPSSYGPLGNLVNGVERLFSKGVKHMTPVDPQLLINLVAAINHSLPTLHNLGHLSLAYSMKALYLTLFFTMLRGGNAVPLSKKEFDPVRHMCWGNITLDHLGRGIIVHVPLSKTNQVGARIHEVPVARNRNFRFCPVSALDHLKSMRGQNLCGPKDPVFVVWEQGSWTVLTKPRAHQFLRGQLEAMGIDPMTYSLYSFRHGGLQWGLHAQPSLAYLKLHSDHKSDVVFSYLSMKASQRYGVALKMTECLNQMIEKL